MSVGGDSGQRGKSIELRAMSGRFEENINTAKNRSFPSVRICLFNALLNTLAHCTRGDMLNHS